MPARPSTRSESVTPAERARLAALERYHVLDTEAEQGFDELAQLAAHLCETPISLVTLVDADRLWFKSHRGLDLAEADRHIAFCDYVVQTGRVFVVNDASVDPRFADDPVVMGPPHIRFYAGAPLITPDGHVLGTLCVLDIVPRVLTPRQLELLTALAHQTMTQLEHRRQAEALAAEVARNEMAQGELARTRRVLDGVLDHTDVMVYAKDLDGRYLMVNQSFARVAGLAVEDILGRSDYDLFDESMAETYRAHDLQVALGGEQQVFEEKATRLDGSEHLSLSTKFALFDDDGQVYAVGGVSTDVTELTAARLGMAQSEQRWRALVEHSPVSVAVYGTSDLLFRYANPHAARLYGVDHPADLVGRSYLDVILPEFRDSFAKSLLQMIRGERAMGMDVRIVGFDGVVRDVEVNAGPITYDGQPAIQVELRDIATRVAADAAVRASEARYRAVFDSAPVGVVEALLDGSFVAVNPRFCSMLGYLPGELLGRSMASVTDDAYVAEQSERRRAMIANGEGYTARRVLLRKDGTELPVLVSLGAIKGADGQTERLIGMVVDVSAQAAADLALSDAHAELAQQKQFVEAVLESVSAGVLACDADENIVLRNAAHRRVTGPSTGNVSASGLAGQLQMIEQDGALLSPDNSPLHQAIGGAELIDVPLRIGQVDGQLYDLLVTARRILDPAGNLLGAVSTFTDVTGEREVQSRLRASASFHDAVLAASPDLIFIVDPVTHATIWASRNLIDLLGYTDAQVIDLGENVIAAVVHPDDVVRMRAANEAARGLAAGEVLQIRYRALHADGSYRWLSRRITPFTRDDDGNVSEILGVARDVTDVVEIEDRLRAAALHDALTGLANRTLLNDRLRSALTRSTRTGHELAVLFCDLDGFKAVNDTGGHAAGDVVLQVTAQRLRTTSRAEDSIARVGGDEFVVIVEPAYRHGISDEAEAVDVRADALSVARRIERAVSQPILVDGRSFVVTASIGLTFAASDSDPDVVLRNADSAMYQAKRAGKNRCEVFDGSVG
ncbi:hypothetical protein acdb102_25290 [Acidothermaceae bacterium B102]|nr:hypothetical protein acdb102_25290 [Acidothermaceae bacterium B102]